MREFVSRTGVDGFTHIADEPGTVWNRFGVKAQGTYVLLDASGKVTHSGYLEDAVLLAGGYVAYYGWYEIRSLSGVVDDPVIAAAGRVQRALATYRPDAG